MHTGAKWIWKKSEDKENTWLNFVKTFTMEGSPEKAYARIAADSKYRLYINGVIAVLEGGLKRGPSKNGTYYDEVEITQYLHAGENTFAVLVEYFGKSGFSHISCGMGGLCFEADIAGKSIFSDSSWRVRKDPVYINPDEFDIPPNFRLSETNIYYDAEKADEDWINPGFDPKDWNFADEICDAGEGAYGTLEKREIPMFRDYGLKDYLNSSDFEGFTASEDTEIELHLPYNAQLTPYLRISAPKGKRIAIRSENKFVSQGVMAVYYTKNGEQEYESFGWINGERIYYTVPAGVTVHALKYRETGYDTDFAGSFECSDEFLNILWQKALRTLYVTMHDNFMDCPDRERAQWWGDVNIDMQMLFYSMDERSLLLYKKGAKEMARWAEDKGHMLTVVPTGTEEFELPLQNLAGIWGFWQYYLYSGDETVPKCVYEMSKNYVMSFDFSDSGLIIHKSGSWDWVDWGDNADKAPMENAWYYMAVSSLKNMAALLRKNDDILLYDRLLKSVRDSFMPAFSKGNCIYDHTENEIPDDRANALAVLSGLASKANYKGITRVLSNTENASPYMEKYVLDALCEMGEVEKAVERMIKRYRQMVEYDCSTLWEYWSMEGTFNHAWSGGPLITMSKYIAGIRPTDTAYREFEIKPRLCGLSYIKCRVPSARGKISLDLHRFDGNVEMTVTVPENSVANVYLPLINENLPKERKYRYTVENGYAHYVLTQGVYYLK